MLTFMLAAFLLAGAAPTQGAGRPSPQAVYLKDKNDKPIPLAIAAEFVDDDALRAAGGSNERAAAEAAKRLFAESIDLDGDASRDWVVFYDCAAVGNCGASVYRATRGGFKLVLVADNVQTLRARRASSKGLRDLEAGRHGSAFDGDRYVYRFDGREYRRVRCMMYSYRFVDARGNEHIRRRPKLTPEKCVDEDEM